jgi:uncharacterized membrane protein YesL
VTLYEIGFLAVLWLTLKTIEKKTSLGNGYRFQFFMIAYLTFRFLLDFIKPHYTYVAGLGTIQLFCLAGLIYYCPTVIKLFTNFSRLTASYGK